ncbi:hypothetical protein ACTXT7_004629 [Hymenolepis weldensis]
MSREFMKKIVYGILSAVKSQRNFLWYLQIEVEEELNVYRGYIDRIDGISQATDVARSVRRWQASHPNLLIRADSLESFYSSNIADRLESLVPNSADQGDAVLISSIAENENNVNEQQSIMKGHPNQYFI